MYKKILVAVNEHINSEVTGRCALHFSKSCRAKFYMCFIAKKGAPEESLDRAQEAMMRLFVEAEKLEVPVESLTRTGEAVKEIDAVVRHEGIDIVFAATRREDLERRFYSGTVVRRLTLKLPCSVAIMRVVHSGRVHPRKILVPLKATIDHLAERARFAGFMAKAFGSKVFVFHTPKPVEEVLKEAPCDLIILKPRHED